MPTTLPNISFERILDPAHNSEESFIGYVTEQVLMINKVCIAHVLLNLEQTDSHQALFECSLSEFSSDSYYRQQFRRGFYTRDKLPACWSCWCPKPLARYGHSKKTGTSRDNACDNTDHEDFWRGFAYIIWMCSALRTPIFEALGIDATAFDGIENFKTWLLLRSGLQCYYNLYNLVTLVYAYFRLQEQGVLSLEPLALDNLEASEYLLV